MDSDWVYITYIHVLQHYCLIFCEWTHNYSQVRLTLSSSPTTRGFLRFLHIAIAIDSTGKNCRHGAVSPMEPLMFSCEFFTVILPYSLYNKIQTSWRASLEPRLVFPCGISPKKLSPIDFTAMYKSHTSPPAGNTLTMRCD